MTAGDAAGVAGADPLGDRRTGHGLVGDGRRSRLGEGEMPALLQSLEELSAPRVLVVADPGGGARVIPLAD